MYPIPRHDAHNTHLVLTPAMRVLIVEDDLDNAQMLELVLHVWGQHTRVAFDGIAALVVADEFRPEVVLLDIDLPKLDGYEVARRLRHREWAKATLIVAITGWELQSDRGNAAAGIDHRLLKPADLEVLRKLLAHRAAKSGRN